MAAWEELDRARETWLRSCRAQAQSWLEQSLPDQGQSYRAKAGAALEEVLEAETHRRDSWDPETFQDRLRERIRQVLARCHAEALQALQAGIAGRATDMGAGAGSALASRSDTPGGAPVAAGDPRSRVATALRCSGSRWRPPSLGPSVPPAWSLEFHPGSLAFYLPGRWARRRAVAQVRAARPEALLEASRHLEQVAREYWDRCLESLDQALELAIQQARAARERGTLPGAVPEPSEIDAEADGCGICADVWQGLYDFFSQFQRQLATDQDAQEQFRIANGFCPAHLWLLERFSSPRGLSAGLPRLVEDIARRLVSPGEGAPGDGGRRGVPGLAQADTCLACQTQDQVTREAVERLARSLGHAAPPAVATPPPELCLQHLPLLLDRVEPGQGAALARRLALRFARVAEAMAGFGLKFDARRRDLLSAAERDAYREALEWLAGSRHLAGRSRGDS